MDIISILCSDIFQAGFVMGSPRPWHKKTSLRGVLEVQDVTCGASWLVLSLSIVSFMAGSTHYIGNLSEFDHGNTRKF